ncbi:MAG: phosphodiester glycosidase family protein [Candidatus Kerfeldbacteria bacterium]|nr:phosphodiester glycosidase family protein [Candidatus Kerfeldbacteria bacterium]
MRYFFCILLTVIVLGTSCTTTITPPTQYQQWTTVVTGVRFKQMVVNQASGQELFSIVKIAPSQQALLLAYDQSNPKTVAEWQQQLQAQVVINASYFDEQYQPTTRLVINGETYGPKLRAGTGVAQSLTGQGWSLQPSATTASDALYAVESYPILLHGADVYTAGSADTAQRTVLATDKTGAIYLMVAEYGVLSLSQLADIVTHELKLDLTMALNLDGGTSTGLVISTPAVQYQENSLPVPAVLYLP